jgi:ribonuclease HI
MQYVEMWTDGSADPNPGRGGWAAILKCRDVIKQVSGNSGHASNNEMELTAVIEGLSALTEPCSVVVYTDSKYIQQGMTSWVYRWQNNGWVTAKGSPVANRELWERLLVLSEHHDIQWEWVKGHTHHNSGNIRADSLARRARERVV